MGTFFRKANLLKAFGAIGVLALVLGVLGTSKGASAAPTLQTFDIDVVQCMGTAAVTPYAGNPAVSLINVPTQRTQACSGEVSTTNTAISIDTGIATGIGARTGLPFSYQGPGWQPITTVEPALVGGVHAYVDILCDQNSGGTSNVDIFSDDTGSGNDEQYNTRTTAWNTTSGTTSGGGVAADETYLNALLPPTGVMARTYRYRADINTLYLGGTTTFSLAVATPLQAIALSPSWAPGAGATGAGGVTVTLLGGSPASPSTQLLCLDGPQSSFAHFDGVTKTPQIAGRYPRWTTEVSAPDLSSGLTTFTLFIDCKTFGAPTGTDADGDCLGSLATSYDTNGDATPDLAIPADTNDANADVDGDGLPDGVEVAWGSSPTTVDADGDGRTDLEEMVGPTQHLSNPNVANTDVGSGDVTPDGGLILDGNSDGAPDVRDNNGDGTGGDVGCESMSAGDHIRCGFDVVVVGGSPAEGDNCSNISNPTQTNTDIASSHGDTYGDACDGDDDADGIPDDAETKFVYENGPGVSGGTFKQCRADGDTNDSDSSAGNWKNTNVGDVTTYVVTALNPLSSDTDGDGFEDGAECQASRGTGTADGGSNPNDAAVKPRANPTGDLDSDGLGSLGAQRDQEQVARTVNFTGNVVSEDVDGDGTDGLSDCDTDADLIPDGIEYFITGTSAVNPDSDADGTADGVEKPTFRKAGCGQFDNGSGVSANDGTDPALPGGSTPNPQGIWSGQGGLDADGDGLPDSGGTETCTNAAVGSPFATLINDDNSDLVTVPGDPTSKDSDGDGVLDGAECVANNNPLLKSNKPSTATCGGATDADADGLPASAEKCKWGTSDSTTDGDGDGVKDCVEANDTTGDGVQNFPGDTLNSAKAANAVIQKTGDYDLNGDGVVNFPGDTLLSAKMANHVGGICL